MKLHASLLAAACALVLSACGGESPPSRDTAADAPPPAPVAATGDDAKVDPASVPEAPWGQVPADGTMDGAGDPGDSAGNGGDGDGAEAGNATTPADDAPGTSADAGDATAAGTGCAVDIEGNDMMKFNMSSITVPSNCSEFTINLTHTGKLPEAAMGHNVVVTATSDMAGIAADGISAGASSGYLKADDDRVIAATEMIGGGESTSVTFDVSKITGGGPYQFFCSFPGHAALMKGTISVQ
ncbi:azurin [Luteimonas sp. MJ246]|uniref:azurin n=1 Tax=Luteimonas sp. MJ174 TaxID=3129237 RepID=UPI0031B9E281